MTVSLSRRDAIARLGVLAAGGALAGCASSSRSPSGLVVASSPSTLWRDVGAGSATWHSVLASADRVTRTIVGLRPYRPGGFVVRTEMLDDKPVVHNYGHGGGGITLSWGTAHLAFEQAARTEHREAAVIGAGAVGLATARILQRQGWRVHIYARDLPPATTSNIAAGQWSPFSVFSPDSVDASFREQFDRAARLAYRYYQDLVSDEYGVRWIDNYSVSDRATGPSSLQERLSDVYPGGRELGPDEHPFPARYVRRFISMLVETSRYLRKMEEDVRRAGATIVVREFRDRSEIAQLSEPLVINCTGLGARELFDDDELVPVRGQLEVLLPQPEVDYIALLGNGLYMMPRSDGIVLGGSFEEGNWSLDADPATSRRIVTGHENFFRQVQTRIDAGQPHSEGP